MSVMPSQLSNETLQMFTALRLLRAGWEGTFVVCAGTGQGAGRAFAMAALAAGGAVLVLEGNASALRIAQRESCCTFVVHTLDEALRALKNELRQRRGISIGLSGTPSEHMDGMVERGVLPAFIGAEASLPVSTLLSWGAQSLHGLGLAPLGPDSIDLGPMLQNAIDKRWHLGEDIAASASDRRVRDGALVKIYASDDPVDAAMRQWLSVAPSLFPREITRSCWLPAQKTV